MPTRPRTALLSALAILLIATAAAIPPPAFAAPPKAPTPPRDGTSGQVTSFYFGKSYLITPVPPFNESHGQTADALGVSVPRALVSNVGTWQVTLTEQGMTVESLDGLSIWASSDQGAQNVRFTINVNINGNSAGQLNTETKPTLSSSPEEFRIDAGNSRMTLLDFPQGSQLSFQLQYRASSSPLPIGPSGDSTFHFYGDLYRSRVDFVTNPFNLTLADIKLDKERGNVNVTEIVKEAFAVDPGLTTYFVSFTGPTNSLDRWVKQVDTRVDPINGTTLIWNWEFLQQGGVASGSYSVTLSAAYVGADANYTNVTVLPDIKFPASAEKAKGFLPGPGAAGAVVAVAVAAIAAGALRSRGGAKRRP
jgi:hypothetical protein